MKYLFLILFSTVALGADAKFHFGERVSYYCDSFYRNCKGFVTDYRVADDGNKTNEYWVETYQCNGKERHTIGWLSEERLKHISEN